MLILYLPSVCRWGDVLQGPECQMIALTAPLAVLTDYFSDAITDADTIILTLCVVEVMIKHCKQDIPFSGLPYKQLG